MTIPVSFRSPPSPLPTTYPPATSDGSGRSRHIPGRPGIRPGTPHPRTPLVGGPRSLVATPPLPPGRAHTRGPGPAQLPRRGGWGGAFRQLGNDNDVAWDGAATHPPRRPKKWDCGGCFTAWLGRDVAGLRRGWVRRGPGGRGVSWTSSCCARALKEATD
jgi:hypothetical protein